MGILEYTNQNVMAKRVTVVLDEQNYSLKFLIILFEKIFKY